MPRYFFHAISGDVRQPDDVGRELPGDQSAFDHAVSGLQALFAAPFGKQIRPGTYSVEVVTADGRADHMPRGPEYLATVSILGLTKGLQK